MSLEALEPDEWSLYHASHITLKPCPFCGSESALPLSYVNREAWGGKTVYRCVVSCTRCLCEIGSNAVDLEEARRQALAKWNRRDGSAR